MQWSDNEDDEEEEDEKERESKESDSDSESEGKHLTKQEKRKNEEVHIRGIEKRMRDEEAPETVEEFDRLLMQNPNSSFLWIKYMAFMLSRGEEDRARQIAEVLTEFSYFFNFSLNFLLCFISALSNVLVLLNKRNCRMCGRPI